MSVNGITNSMVNAYQSTTTTRANSNQKDETTDKTTNAVEETGVVYEPSSTETTSNTAKTYNKALVDQLKADLKYKTQQMQGIVEKLMGKQSSKANSVLDLLQGLKNGTVSVDAATSAQAQKEIGEDGYWGVNQTSDRLVEMAKALSGGDASKADTMIAAMKKGFEQATKAFGGQLPDICSQTISAATDKLNQWKASLN